MITDRIRVNIKPDTVIPKPKATADFKVKGWGKRRGQEALIYFIPNHLEPGRPHQKGITADEFTAAYNELMGSGNFTTIGGVFQLLGIAIYADKGTYVRHE